MIGVVIRIDGVRWDCLSAIADLNQALQLEPKSASAYHLRSQVYDAMGDIAKAKADAKKAEELLGADQEKEP